MAEISAKERSATIGRASAPVAAAASGLPVLQPGEGFVGIRSAARVTTYGGNGRDSLQVRGRLIVTTARLIHIADQAVLSIDLDEIADASLSAETLLLTTTSGCGVAIESRLLRHLYATISALRTERQASSR